MDLSSERIFIGSCFQRIFSCFAFNNKKALVGPFSEYCVARNIVDTFRTYLNMIVCDGPLLVDTRERGKELVFPSLQHTHNISVDRIRSTTITTSMAR